MTDRVLGVDACKTGWIGIVLERDRVWAHYASTIGELVSTAESAGELAVVGIDMPIGLPDVGRRRADVQARQVVGPRRSSVFTTPVRPAVDAGDYAATVRVSRELTGGGISVQAFSLMTRIREVDTWVRECTQRVVEVHPEVSFAWMAGATLLDSKHTWAGVERRRGLLNEAGIKLATDLGDAGRAAGVDDVLDAAAAAWSARRVAARTAISLPDPPESFSDGLPCAIWA